MNYISLDYTCITILRFVLIMQFRASSKLHGFDMDFDNFRHNVIPFNIITYMYLGSYIVLFVV